MADRSILKSLISGWTLIKQQMEIRIMTFMAFPAMCGHHQQTRQDTFK